jgi:hypothetical protein
VTITQNIDIAAPVEFIFDHRREARSILSAWDEFTDARGDAFAEMFPKAPTFADDETHLGLQAADMWTWWVRHWYEEDNSERPTKMQRLDFESWRGTPRNHMVFHATEEFIFDTLRDICTLTLLQHQPR